MLHSVRSRLLVIVIPSALFIWLCSAVLTYLDTKKEFNQLFDAQLAQSGQVLLNLGRHEYVESKQRRLENQAPERRLTNEPVKDGSLLSDNFIELAHHYKKDLAFQLWFNQNRLILRSKNTPSTPMSNTFEGFSDEIINSNKWRVFSIQSDDGLIRAQMAESYSVRENISFSIVSHTMFPLLMTIPILGLALWLVVTIGFSPLSRITNEFQSLSPKDLQKIDTDGIPSEVIPVTLALNRVIANLQEAFSTERRFTSDAAHELRTPLAVLKTHAEVALHATEQEERDNALRQLVRGVNRATRLVEQLLTLARLDPETNLKGAKRFDLFIVAENVISEEALVALEKNIDISLNGTRGKFVFGSSAAISVLMRNLINNAIRYTPKNGIVKIMITRINESIIFSVADSGPGIPATERQKVFERFYRQLGTKVAGSGLGLSIVTRIADLHDLSFELAESEFRGLLINVKFKPMDREPK